MPNFQTQQRVNLLVQAVEICKRRSAGDEASGEAAN